jgi:Signal transduction histidine kinase
MRHDLSASPAGEMVTDPTVIEALHCLRVAITVFDADERLTFANAHFGYMFRSLPPAAELIGKRYDELIRLEISGGDIGELGEDAESYVARRRAQLFARDYGARDIPLKDGRIVEIKTRRTPSLGWIALWTDVTEARRNVDRLNAAIQLSADAFAFYDRSDTLRLCNGEYATLIGADNPKDIVGFKFSDIVMRVALNSIPHDHAKAWLDKRRAIHSEAAGAMTMELNEGRAYLLRDRAASDGGRIIVLTDVTEHQRVEKALAEQTRTLADMRKELELTEAKSRAQANYLADLTTKLDQTAKSADKTKKTLLRTMSHELKTPLNAIIGFSDLLGTLADSAGPDQIREYSALINMGGKNLLKMINQILDLTRISGGRYELNRQQIDAGLALWNAKDRYDGTAYDKEITIHADDAAPGLIVEADENAFNAIVGHLVENAVSFTQNGGEVWLRAEGDEDTVILTVTDNGPGVASEDLSRIQEPFEQGGRSTHDHPSGAGLGLTLVKAYCELHGGRLTLKSATGAGFEAIVRLPRAEAGE